MIQFNVENPKPRKMNVQTVQVLILKSLKSGILSAMYLSNYFSEIHRLKPKRFGIFGVRSLSSRRADMFTENHMT